MIGVLNTASLGTGREKIAKTLILHFKKFNCKPMVTQLIERLLPVEDQGFKSRLC
jgi:hypothetical protein